MGWLNGMPGSDWAEGYCWVIWLINQAFGPPTL